MTYDKDWALRWLNDFGERVQENKQLLSDLDQAIVDGDHGINMARGVHGVKKTCSQKNPAAVTNELLISAVRTDSYKAGGSGPRLASSCLNTSESGCIK
ncbi:DAK2 domain-containing protein [Listeria monocytogenes]|uniref:DAK2 domain-containing protein n=1 Tax=Listeria monocytogenes TaxID=1639 RepID=UPI000E6D2643|nr:DAK2 domain-containing protein [Listeria monocytogenes]